MRSMGDLADPDCDPADDLPSPEQRATSALGDLWSSGPIVYSVAIRSSRLTRNPKAYGHELRIDAYCHAPYNSKSRALYGAAR